MKKAGTFFQDPDSDVVTDVEKSCFGAIVRFVGIIASLILLLSLLIQVGSAN